jgi:hypothetical protein
MRGLFLCFALSQSLLQAEEYTFDLSKNNGRSHAFLTEGFVTFDFTQAIATTVIDIFYHLRILVPSHEGQQSVTMDSKYLTEAFLAELIAEESIKFPAFTLTHMGRLTYKYKRSTYKKAHKIVMSDVDFDKLLPVALASQIKGEDHQSVNDVLKNGELIFIIHPDSPAKGLVAFDLKGTAGEMNVSVGFDLHQEGFFGLSEVDDQAPGDSQDEESEGEVVTEEAQAELD